MRKVDNDFNRIVYLIDSYLESHKIQLVEEVKTLRERLDKLEKDYNYVHGDD